MDFAEELQSTYWHLWIPVYINLFVFGDTESLSFRNLDNKISYHIMNTFLFLNVFILLLVINKRNTHYILHVVDVITNIIILYDIYTVIINEYLLEEQIYLCIISYIESNIFTVTDITEFNMRLSTCTSNTHSCTNYVCMYTRKIWKLHILC